MAGLTRGESSTTSRHLTDISRRLNIAGIASKRDGSKITQLTLGLVSMLPTYPCRDLVKSSRRVVAAESAERRWVVSVPENVRSRLAFARNKVFPALASPEIPMLQDPS